MDKKDLDSQILQKINQGAQSKEEAFKLLAKTYRPILFPQIHHIIKNQEWTKDCLQNVLIKVLQNIGNFEEESSFYSWLYRIAHNEALNFIILTHELSEKQSAPSMILFSKK